MLTATGQLAAPIPLGDVIIPGRIDLIKSGDETAIVWELTADDFEQAPRIVSEFRGLVDDFIYLADAGDDEVLQFGRRWGVLRLCLEHVLPSAHDLRCHESREEPTQVWREFAAQARGMILAAANLHNGRLPDKAVWDAFQSEPPIGIGSLNVQQSPEHRDQAREFFGRRSVASERSRLTRHVQVWIDLADVRPAFTWGSGQPSITLGAGSLFSALTLQLLYAVARAGAMATCSECGRPHDRPTRGRRGQRVYCGQCRATGAPQRNATRAWRLRKQLPVSKEPSLSRISK